LTGSSSSKIQSDFDRIARLSPDAGDHNNHYHNFLLKHIPTTGAQALDIGCGTGMFSRRLAQHFAHVFAIDLSPGMLEITQERSACFPNIDYQLADAMTCDLPAGQYDCIASIATLHHLPLKTILARIKNALKVGGVLLILDLFKAQSAADFLAAALGNPLNLILMLVKKGRLREPPAVRAAWEEHGRSDVYPTLSQVRETCANVLPGSRITRHLLWRYSIIWKKQ